MSAPWRTQCGLPACLLVNILASLNRHILHKRDCANERKRAWYIRNAFPSFLANFRIFHSGTSKCARWKLSELFWCVDGDVQRSVLRALKYICNALAWRHRERQYEADVTYFVSLLLVSQLRIASLSSEGKTICLSYKKRFFFNLRISLTNKCTVY